MKNLANKIWKFAPFVLIFLIFFIAPADTDLGWHLRYGEYFWQTGEILRENVLTYFLSNYEWSNSYFLYDILTFRIWKFGGIGGLTIASGILGSGLFWLFRKIETRREVANCGLFLIFLAAAWGTFQLGFRAQIFSLAGILATFYLLKKSESKPKFLFALPPLFLLWANLHGGFFLGLAILIFWSVGKIFEKPRNFSKFLGIILASFLATLVNPFGIGIFTEAWQHFQTPMQDLIAEWITPNIWQQSAILTAAIFLLLAAWQKSRDKFFWSATIISFAILALAARRNIALFSLIILLAGSEIWSTEFLRLEKNKFISVGKNVLVGGGILFLLFTSVPRQLETSRAENYCRAIPRNYPCGAVEFLRERGSASQNIFSHFEWGGFLEWQLPANRFFVDGRMPAWPTTIDQSPYSVYLSLIQAQPGWEDFLTRLETNQLLIGNGTFLDLELQKNNNPNWREVFRDEVAVVYESE
ncbi:hypothetical protein K9N08_03240 [Candidatus Gracilibacteria bacterium]|nr:hypothetical protein [Candidatus Gracilibacteria bacterium]MCF7856545.1 hypothetical protein [Candidatus Gracilibacteria bacterium]MCF7896868.1 hypothetical protein [Candidatus Gracilibacteria bacterium]